MNKPVQQHYLPKQLYLKSFSNKDKPGYIYLYKKDNKEPILVNINNVAKERHLYSLATDEGKYDYTIEEVLAKLEGEVKPIIDKLRQNSSMVLTGHEKNRLSEFIAFQVVRTPAFINNQKAMQESMYKSFARQMVKDQKGFTAYLEGLKKEKPQEFANIDADSIRKFILDGEFDIKFDEKSKYFLGISLELVPDIFRLMMVKKIVVIKSRTKEFITSDFPVLLIEDTDVPFQFRGGFAYSDVLLPISPETLVYLKREDKPSLVKNEKDVFEVRKYSIYGKKVDEVNEVLTESAQKYIFSSFNSQSLAKSFAKTEAPQRFSVTEFGPYSILSQKNSSKNPQLRFNIIAKKKNLLIK